MKTHVVVAAAISVLDDLMLYFNRRDQEARASTLNYPHVRFAAGNVTVLETAEDFMTNADGHCGIKRVLAWHHRLRRCFSTSPCLRTER
jgi:hypothetical protein